MAETKDEKAKRMADALRANLKRRKAQKRDIAGSEKAATSDERQFRTNPLTAKPLKATAPAQAPLTKTEE